MAITDNSLIELVVKMRWNDIQIINAWQYQVGVVPGNVEPVHIAEAYWNHIKTAYRATVPSTMPTPFQSIFIRELNNAAGDYAEFDIPAPEKTGTRNPPSQAELLPPFVGIGVRLVVGTRVTRPGQKRFGFLMEGDSNAGVVPSGTATLFVTLMNVMSVNMLLGAPAATVELQPIVVRKDAQGYVTAFQNITGYLINPYITTQNSRKYGRGA
jgi:hypothetical protein